MAFSLKQAHPSANIHVVDSSGELGGNQTYWIQDTKVLPSWVREAASSCATNPTYRTPKNQRELESKVLVLSPNSLRERLETQVKFTNGSKVIEISPNLVRLEDGTELRADLVIDAQDWNQSLPVAYRKSFAMELLMHEPHGVRPCLADTLITQVEGFRFLESIPLSDSQLLIQDNYLGSDYRLNAGLLEKRIFDYLGKQPIAQITHKIARVSPLPLSGQLHFNSEVPLMGMRGGMFHHMTGDPLALAINVSDILTQVWKLGPRAVRSTLMELGRENWDHQTAYRNLNRSLYRKTEPRDRHLFFERLYNADSKLAQRFHFASNTLFDKIRLIGFYSRHKPFFGPILERGRIGASS